MGHKNVQLVNDILNEVAHYIIATVGQHSLDWEYACYVSSKNTTHREGEFFLFHNKKPISFKSSELVHTLYKLFEAYKIALNENLKDQDVSIKYVIQYADLKVDLKLEKGIADKWDSLSAPNPLNPYDLLIEN